MAGFLPLTRPTTTSYGAALANEKPVRNPALEADATDYNNTRADLAFAAGVIPVAMIRVQNNGAAAKILGYKINLTYVTITRTALGKVTVDIAAGANVTVIDADVGVYRASASTAAFGNVEIASASQIKVHTSSVAADLDCDFLLKIY